MGCRGSCQDSPQDYRVRPRVPLFLSFRCLGRGGSAAYWAKDDLVLQENMILSVDLPIRHAGIGGSAHLEDLTLITKDGGTQINDIGNRIVIV
jgi:Xaa-Pro aminopeptidase